MVPSESVAAARLTATRRSNSPPRILWPDPSPSDAQALSEREHEKRWSEPDEERWAGMHVGESEAARPSLLDAWRQPASSTRAMA
eukprot:3208250-Rhodomonas_salina.1